MALEVTPSSARTAPLTRLSISLRSGHPAMVSATFTVTSPSTMVTSRTMPRSTMLRCSSGSSTGRRTSMTCSVVTGMADRLSCVGRGGRVPGIGGPARPVHGTDLHYGHSANPVSRRLARSFPNAPPSRRRIRRTQGPRTCPAPPQPTRELADAAIAETVTASLSPTEFASVVTAITSAFGDPTRRDIYLYAHEVPRGHHRGVDGRPLRSAPQRGPPPSRQARRRRLSRGRHARPAAAPVDRRRSTAAPSPGSPSRSRSATTTCWSRCWARRCRCCRAEQAEAMAEEVGVEYGRAMAASHGRRRRRADRSASRCTWWPMP